MLDLIDAVAADLESVDATGVFTGASTLPLLVTDPVVRGALRHTRDIDVIVLVRNLGEYTALQRSLRHHGYEDGLDEEGPMCRLWRRGVPVDLMPCPDVGVGTDNRWFLPGTRSAQRTELPSGRQIALLSPVYFAAAKIEAFRSRGRLEGEPDWYASADLEDLLALVDGCPQLASFTLRSPKDVRAHIAGWARELLSLPDLRDVIAGNVSDTGRSTLLVQRLEALSIGIGIGV